MYVLKSVQFILLSVMVSLYALGCGGRCKFYFAVPNLPAFNKSIPQKPIPMCSFWLKQTGAP